MAYISSIGLGIPKHMITQDRVKSLVQHIFPFPEEEMNKFLPVFDNANIDERQLVVTDEWFQKEHTFEDRNKLYQTSALSHSLEAIDDCLTNKDFLDKDIPYEAIDIIFYISSTGISTPSIDAYIMNERSFHRDLIRMPLWGLGCAGGAIGLARAFDLLKAYPQKNALVICCELCSLTFQKNDLKKSNLIGTAIFGDGISCALLMGEMSPYLTFQKGNKPKIMQTSSYTEKDSINIMGWEITNSGFEVIFSKQIPALVETIWKNHLLQFLTRLELTEEDIDFLLAHPGGSKVLMAIEDSLQINQTKLNYSYEILRKHGNMSSVTIFYVLHQWMKDHTSRESKSLLTALGPGFSSELLLLEWQQ